MYLLEPDSIAYEFRILEQLRVMRWEMLWIHIHAQFAKNIPTSLS